MSEGDIKDCFNCLQYNYYGDIVNILKQYPEIDRGIVYELLKLGELRNDPEAFNAWLSGHV